MKSPLRSLAAFVVLVSSLVFAGCAGTATTKSTGEVIDDATITTKVKTAFARDPGVKALDVKVETFKGNVQLSGFVDSAAEKQRAEEIARSIEGVVKVQNNVTLKSRVTP